MFTLQTIRPILWVISLTLLKSTNALAEPASNFVVNQPHANESTVPLDNYLAKIEASVYQKINAYRVSQGLSALTFDATISSVARIHSQHMASGVLAFGHADFQSRIQTLTQSLPFISAGENVASNAGYSDPATTAISGWLKSAQHHATIVGNYRRTGIGVARSEAGELYFTQIFWY